jgi:hypothetical protein
MQRATAVRDFLVNAGAIAADAALLEGKGSSEPKFAAKAGVRFKNRRVELEFVSLSEKEEIVQIPSRTIPGVVAAPTPAPVTYQREVIEQEPAWLRRALRTPTVHKRTVDVYRSKEESQTESTSRTWVNRTPVAQNDSYSVASGSTTVLAVLGNDSDPDTGDVLTVASVGVAVLANDSDADGDPLTIVSVTQPVGGNGTVRIEGPAIVFTPKNSFLIDSFTYTISDGKGGTSTATVELVDP